MKKVICIQDPNPDYKDWVFNNLGVEVTPLNIHVGGIYTTNGKIFNEKNCWGKKQDYFYLTELIEFGSVPKKYFVDYFIHIDSHIKKSNNLNKIHLN